MSNFRQPEPQQFHTAPEYWMRIYDQTNEPEESTVMFGDREVKSFNPLAGQRVVIFGYSTRSPYDEDRRVEEADWLRNGRFPAVCFSVLEPTGEYGPVPMAEAFAISREEFETARDSGWDPTSVRAARRER